MYSLQFTKFQTDFKLADIHIEVFLWVTIEIETFQGTGCHFKAKKNTHCVSLKFSEIDYTIFVSRIIEIVRLESIKLHKIWTLERAKENIFFKNS